MPLSLYAAPSYLEQHGTPEDPDVSLAGHAAILFADARSFALENDIYSATVAGLGIALLPTAVAGREAALVHIPTATSPSPRVIWQAVHADLQRSARVRAVLDFLAEVVTPSTGSESARRSRYFAVQP